MELKPALLSSALLLVSCRATQVLTTEGITTDSTNREQVERVITSTVSKDGRTTTVHELETRTSQMRQQAKQSRQAPAPPKPAKRQTPWYDRWARRIAGITIALVAVGIYLKFFSPFRIL